MQITLKNVKHYPSMSEETECFEAVVYIDGKKAGRVANRGHGGSHEMDSAVWVRIAAYAKTLPHKTANVGGESFTYPQSAETLIDDALEVVLRGKEEARIRKIFDRSIDAKVMYTKDGGVYGVTYGSTKSLPSALLERRTKHMDTLAAEGHTVLNRLPADEAFAIWKQYVLVGA